MENESEKRSAGLREGQKFLNAEQVADRYDINARTWRRRVDDGSAPRPIRIGSLVRWSIDELEEWEQGGCKRVR